MRANLGIVLIVGSTLGCVQSSDPMQSRNALLQNRVDQLTADLEASRGTEADLRRELAIARQDLEDALGRLEIEQRYQAEVDALFREIYEKYGQEDVRPGPFGPQIGSALLFDSGSATLKEEGVAILTDIAAKLLETEMHIRIDGHTDSQPITRSRDRFPTNWDLSGTRALAVLKFLEERGVPSERMHFSGYSMYRPIAANDSRGGNARNRRVEIHLLPHAPAPNRD